MLPSQQKLATMKILFLSIIACALSSGAQSQTQKADSLYIVTYTTGSAWDVSKNPGEQIHFKEHSMNLSSWRKSGMIKFGARYSDKGIIVITAATMKEVTTLITSDPAVSNKLFNVDIQKLNVFYDGCIGK